MVSQSWAIKKYGKELAEMLLQNWLFRFEERRRALAAQRVMTGQQAVEKYVQVTEKLVNTASVRRSDFFAGETPRK